jgi:alpha-glucosidase (family GH31 glycosyl hydrolase)
MDIFIKTSGENATALAGGLFCGNALYPDFTHPNATKYWHAMLEFLYSGLGL